ncbi:MAG: hypothetical protein ACI9C0_000122 [Alteromonadaceae bacterium]|jgi:hypothetical protein|tara:strand:+ start:3311 stop:3529 length:219 start_codon:yes stop_codon:yes gene_type:complete
MKYYFFIDISPAQYLPYYQGQIKSIVTTTTTGLKVQFPAMHLRKYLTSAGIRGEFCLETKSNKFSSLIKLSK